MQMEKITGKHVLITGASSGIGKAMALVFAARNNNLILVARRDQLLEELKRRIEQQYSVSVVCIRADLALNDGAQGVLASIDAKGLVVDVLINNAGYSLPPSAFHETELSQYFDLMRVGINSSMALTHALLPGMVRRGYGRVLIMASIAGGFNGLKNHAVYCATKAFLIRMGLALNEENKERNVRFTVVCPGFVESEFHVRAGSVEVAKKMPSWAIKTSEQAAMESYHALGDNKPYVVLGLPNKFVLLLIKFLPMPWGTFLFGRSGL